VEFLPPLVAWRIGFSVKNGNLFYNPITGKCDSDCNGLAAALSDRLPATKRSGKMYQRIFVPIDDSKTSLYALEQTCRLAKATDAVLVAVHVVDLTDLKREASRLPNSEELYAAEMQVADHAEAVMKQAGVKYEVSTLENDGMRIADVLIKEAVRQECDLIAMGTHGFSGLLHLLMGSVAEGVLRQAPMPVLLFRRPDSEA